MSLVQVFGQYGHHLALYQWTNPSVKGHMAVFTHSVVGNWTVPRTTGRDYFDQLTAKVRE